MLFCNTKDESALVFNLLKAPPSNENGPLSNSTIGDQLSLANNCWFLNADKTQREREADLDKFNRSNEHAILVASDLASRGLNISNVDLVVNFRIPPDAATFTNRAGRAGRMENYGENYTFFTRFDLEDKGTQKTLQRTGSVLLKSQGFSAKGVPPSIRDAMQLNGGE